MTIQEQLREHAELIDDGYGQPRHVSPWAVELYEAADRIDALQAALRNIDQAATIITAKKIARQALEVSS